MAKKELLDLSTLMDNVISDNINDYSITLYGKGGSGKSTFANALKRRLGGSASFFFEPRAKGLGGIKAIECLEWSYFPAYVQQLKQYDKKNIKVPFDNVIIDSVDSAYELCTDYIKDENEWNTLQGDYGARYSTVGSEFKNPIRELRQLGYIVTFATHETDEESHDVNGEMFMRKVPIVSNQIKGMVLDQVDFILYLDLVHIKDDDGNLKEVRRLWLKNNPYVMLKVPLFGLPDYIEYEEVNDGVDKFLAAFDKAVKITRDKYNNGEDISNPNEENDLEVEFVAPKMTKFDDIDSAVDASPEVSLSELHEQAVTVRDKMLADGMERSEMIALLKGDLGTATINKCTDKEKLKAFIAKYE